NRLDVSLNINSKKLYSLSPNAVELLPEIKNNNGYICLTTKVNSNLLIGDIVYISSISGDTSYYSDSTYILDNVIEISGCTDWYYHPYLSGYKVVDINNNRNEITIDRYYNDKIKNKKIYDHYLSKISVTNMYMRKGDIDCVLFKNVMLNEFSGSTDDINLIQGIILSGSTPSWSGYTYISGGTIQNVIIGDKYDSNYRTINTKYDDYPYSTYYSYNNNIYGFNIIKNQTLSATTINNGYFENDIIKSSVIYNGRFKNCKIYDSVINNGLFSGSTVNSGSTWNYGVWYDGDFQLSAFTNGIWNSGTFSGKTWYNGIFNDGYFAYSDWINGIFNGGDLNFSRWNNGIFNDGNFLSSNWSGGTFNGGYLSNSYWYDGVFVNGDFYSSTWYGGRFVFGKFSGPPMSGLTAYSNWINGNFYNGEILNTYWVDGTFYNGHFIKGYWSGGTFNNGYMEKTTWLNGTFNNGKYYGGITGLTIGINPPNESIEYIWYDGTFNNGYFDSGLWIKGNFNNGVVNNSIFREVNWKNGTFNGNLIGPRPNVGIVTDFVINWSGGTFNNGSFGLPIHTLSISPGHNYYFNWWDGNFYGGSFYNNTGNTIVSAPDSAGGWSGGTFYNGNFYGDFYDGDWVDGNFVSPPAVWHKNSTPPSSGKNEDYDPFQKCLPGGTCSS
ncbi:MAG: hypothetical protein KDH96_08730, partial [Candidatus Riesia sp.]|nr:hypothetical protein [Candidatus Riesia sp.]